MYKTTLIFFILTFILLKDVSSKKREKLDNNSRDLFSTQVELLNSLKPPLNSNRKEIFKYIDDVLKYRIRIKHRNRLIPMVRNGLSIYDISVYKLCLIGRNNLNFLIEYINKKRKYKPIHIPGYVFSAIRSLIFEKHKDLFINELKIEVEKIKSHPNRGRFYLQEFSVYLNIIIKHKWIDEEIKNLIISDLANQNSKLFIYSESLEDIAFYFKNDKIFQNILINILRKKGYNKDWYNALLESNFNQLPVLFPLIYSTNTEKFSSFKYDKNINEHLLNGETAPLFFIFDNINNTKFNMGHIGEVYLYKWLTNNYIDVNIINYYKKNKEKIIFNNTTKKFVIKDN